MQRPVPGELGKTRGGEGDGGQMAPRALLLGHVRALAVPAEGLGSEGGGGVARDLGLVAVQELHVEVLRQRPPCPLGHEGVEARAVVDGGRVVHEARVDPELEERREVGEGELAAVEDEAQVARVLQLEAVEVEGEVLVEVVRLRGAELAALRGEELLHAREVVGGRGHDHAPDDDAVLAHAQHVVGDRHAAQADLARARGEALGEVADVARLARQGQGRAVRLHAHLVEEADGLRRHREALGEGEEKVAAHHHGRPRPAVLAVHQHRAHGVPPQEVMSRLAEVLDLVDQGRLPVDEGELVRHVGEDLVGVLGPARLANQVHNENVVIVTMSDKRDQIVDWVLFCCFERRGCWSCGGYNIRGDVSQVQK
mmetsp:Transcript_19143/g.52806  ORF Transcript_19143/g.52806 Transcript_19143/m.52806 type:complete len:369 (-) Transcript_19143:236-1342(-)